MDAFVYQARVVAELAARPHARTHARTAHMRARMQCDTQAAARGIEEERTGQALAVLTYAGRPSG
jgi:hypothetical protein